VRYKFLNVNPLGKLELDCVCRAISFALQISYEEIEHKLNIVGDLFDCESLCVCCYKYLLDNVFQLQRVEEFRGMTVGEFAKMCPIGTYIVRVDGHLTSVHSGTIFDTWDCGKEIVDLIWKVE
jgi:hypothetical protein